MVKHEITKSLITRQAEMEETFLKQFREGNYTV